MKYLYCVAKNGVCSVRKYEVIKETPKTYVVKGGISERVLKSTMSNKYCVFFEDEKSAQLFYERIKYNPKKPLTNFDRIKAMSVEEMAIFLDEIQDDALRADGCVYDLRLTTDWREWLESEVEE